MQLTLYYNYVEAKITWCFLRQIILLAAVFLPISRFRHMSLLVSLCRKVGMWWRKVASSIVLCGLLGMASGQMASYCCMILCNFFSFSLSHSSFQLLWMEYVSSGSTLSIDSSL